MNIMHNFIKKESFQPSFFGIFLNPFYHIRRLLHVGIKDKAKQLEGKLLDFGCGQKPYRNLFNVSEYVGVDIKVSGHNHRNSSVDIFYDGKKIPVPDSYFDSFICFEVIEHIFNIDEVLREIHRVMKRDGTGIITVPFSWNEHEIPYDYARYSSYGIKYLLEKNGFEVISLTKLGNNGLVVIQLLILGVYEFLRPLKKIGYALTLIISIPLNILGMGLIYRSRDQKMYFNSLVIVKKK